MPQPRRTYVIADLHGRLDLLNMALDAILKREPGTLITLGDYVDRGPDSRGVIERLMAGGPDGWRWINLQGNHEEITLIACAQPEPGIVKWWIKNGGGATLASYGQRQGKTVDTGIVPREHLTWMAYLPLTHFDDHRVYAHAGVLRDKSLAEHNMLVTKDNVLVACWMYYDGTDEGWHEQDGVLRHVVHGHHKGESHPLLLPGRTNLDTGAYYTGRLVVGVFDDDKPGGPVEFIEIKGDEW